MKTNASETDPEDPYAGKSAAEIIKLHHEHRRESQARFDAGLPSRAPWKWRNRLAYMRLQSYDDGDVLDIELDKDDPSQAAGLSSLPSPADMALIAAAPEMLELLRLWAKCGCWGPGSLCTPADLCGPCRARVLLARMDDK